jgi:hypothetical protein
MKFIHLGSYHSEGSQKGKELLRLLHNYSDREISITESPDKADLILIAHSGNELSNKDYITEVQSHNLISRYPEKCFTISFFKDKPLVLNRGVYESPMSLWNKQKRVITGAYLPGMFNPLIKKSYVTGYSSIREEKQNLASFIGRRSHQIRHKLFNLRFKRKDILIQDSSHFSAWSKKSDKDKTADHEKYLSILTKSKFAICPRGLGSSSIRLFEAMSLGVCPVIISDEWVPPIGPDWDECSIFLKESEIGSLEKILEEYENKYSEMGDKALIAFREYFSDEKYFDYLIDRCMGIKENQKISEAVYWKFRKIQVFRYSLYQWYHRKRQKMYWAVFN